MHTYIQPTLTHTHTHAQTHTHTFTQRHIHAYAPQTSKRKKIRSHLTDVNTIDKFLLLASWFYHK